MCSFTFPIYCPSAFPQELYRSCSCSVVSPVHNILRPQKLCVSNEYEVLSCYFPDRWWGWAYFLIWEYLKLWIACLYLLPILFGDFSPELICSCSLYILNMNLLAAKYLLPGYSLCFIRGEGTWEVFFFSIHWNNVNRIVIVKCILTNACGHVTTPLSLSWCICHPREVLHAPWQPLVWLPLLYINFAQFRTSYKWNRLLCVSGFFCSALCF